MNKKCYFNKKILKIFFFNYKVLLQVPRINILFQSLAIMLTLGKMQINVKAIFESEFNECEILFRK